MKNSKHIFHLSEVMDIDVLQEIQDRFSEATGLAAIIVDYQGKLITRYSNFSAFCERMRKLGNCGCEKSDAYAGIEAVRAGKPYIYRCHMGLVDVSAPIVVDGQYLGGIMTGQVLVEKDDLDNLEHISKPSINIKDYPELEELYGSIPTMPLRKVKASAQLLFTIANYIAEKGVNSIVQQELNEQRVRLIQEENARTVLENALTEAELKAMRSQVNPHFLFNTLNTISRQALLEEAPKTQEIVFALAELLRGSLRKIDHNTTLRDELLNIKNYLLIKETRLLDRIKVDYKIDVTCLDSEMPLFTLQPLLENALLHGLEPKEGGGSLSITAARENDSIRIDIIDDGLGMPPETVKKILSLESTASGHNELTGLGMSSVFKRLHHHFGDGFRWEIKSQLGEGTKITLFMPDRGQWWGKNG